MRSSGRKTVPVAQRPIFGSYPYPPNFKNVHEYILVFAKPSASKMKGKKVQPFAELMKGVSPALPVDLQLPDYAPPAS
jgi:hypothetical protein